MRGRLGVSPRFKLFDTQTTCSSKLSDIAALSKLKQTRTLEDDNSLGGLMLKQTKEANFHKQTNS